MIRRLIHPIRIFIEMESASGVLLLITTLISIGLIHSPFERIYSEALHAPLLGASLQHWINDGLMTIFFLVVGLEIKREFSQGMLSQTRQAALPVIAAFGGMLFPALIYRAFNPPFSEGAAGWGIPMATDIAFAVGALSLLGKRVRMELKVFLTALAIVDDLGAVAVIAIFYTSHLYWPALGVSAVLFLFLGILNKKGITAASVYLVLGILGWWVVLQSGIHATVAGVLLAGVIPISTGRRIEAALHPWVSFGIVPLFALANAGVSLSADSLVHPVSFGIIGGLFLGKQLGISLFSWAAIRLKFARFPGVVSVREVYGVACLGGIGFTMSLFVATLSFEGSHLLGVAKLSILIASVLSAALGVCLLLLKKRG